MKSPGVKTKIHKAMALASLFVWLTLAVSAEPGLLPPLDYATVPVEFSQAWQAAASPNDPGLRTSGIATFDHIAQSHPGTTLGAVSMLKAAYYSCDDPVDQAARYQRMAEAYRGTQYELTARIGLIKNSIWPARPGDELIALDLLAQEYGAPPLQTVLEADPEQGLILSSSVRVIPEGTRAGLLQVLSEMYWNLRALGRFEDAFTLGFFVQNAIPPVFGTSLRDELIPDLASERLGLEHRAALYIEGTAIDPLVTPLAPTPGTFVSNLNEVACQIVVGDYRNGVVRWDNLTLSLDGQPLSPQIWSSINRTMEPGQLFETLTVKAPVSSLSSGVHTVSVSATTSLFKEGGAGRTNFEWTFYVGSGPSEVRLGPSNDSTLRLRDPHLNEGANPRLILEKIQGKTTHALVGFDLSQQNLTGLTSASLVLTIDPSDSPTGWGNGRNVLAAPISIGWLEGNGVDFGVPNSQKTSGSGAGVTWFSPVDEDISNNYANSAVNWNGAGAASGPPTALAVQIHNHQAGQVSFDVTQDVLSGSSSWLVRREDENVGSQVHFYSKEGGGASAGPRLVLHYGASANKPAGNALLARAWDTPAAVVRNLAGLGLTGGPMTNLLILQARSSGFDILSSGLRSLVARREMAVLL